MSPIELRYQAKLAARAGHTVPVVEQVADPKNINGDTPEAIDGRYRAKLATRQKTVVPVEPAPPAEPEAVNAASAAPAAVVESETKKAEPEAASNRKNK